MVKNTLVNNVNVMKFRHDFKKTEPRKMLRVEDDVIKSFHRAIFPVIVCGNFFGLLPITRASTTNENDLQFKFLHPVSIFSILLILCSGFEYILTIMVLLGSDFKIDYIVTMIYNTVCIFGPIYLFIIAKYRWKNFMLAWRDTERVFLVSPYLIKAKGLSFLIKLRIYSAIIISLAIFDHCVFMYSAIDRNETKIQYCNPDKRNFWKNFFVSERSILLSVIPYHHWEIPFLEWYDITKTVSWTYSEMLIICISIALAARFDQITSRLEKFREQSIVESYWAEVRSDYMLLCDLVIKANTVLSPLILVYGFSNLFFICERIFRQYDADRSGPERFYYFYSAGFLMLRTYWVFYHGSSVNENSKAPLKILRDAPTKNWCIDFNRLVNVIEYDTIALTGGEFFYLTRGLVLAIAGILLTYQLVLIQQTDAIVTANNKTVVNCGDILVSL